MTCLYTYNGSQLTGEIITTTTDGTVTNTETLYYSYDASGKPVAVKYNDVLYFYVTNLQGDVVAIMNSSGTVVVEYTYDAWGYIRATSGSMASTLGRANAIRYRGYVYDRETGLYYLQSRYYNPGTGRFINADALVSTGQGLLGNNMFAYCGNNAVNYSDPCGMCIHRLDFWNDCEKCKSKTLAEKVADAAEEGIDTGVQLSAIVVNPVGTALLVGMHYLRNTVNETCSLESNLSDAYSLLGAEDDKFHQNNQKDGRNRKYVKKGWFSSEAVFYSDGTLNDTPEDMGTFNLYYGDNELLNIVIHGAYDVLPYMIWGNSPSDSTTIIDRIEMIFR